MPTEGEPVLVVGAGPVGLASALTLTRAGVPCRVIDANPHPVNESRALGIQARTLEVAERLGAADRLIDQGVIGRGARFFLGGREKMHVDFTGLDTPYPCILFLEQSRTERVFGGLLAELGVNVERPVTLTSLTQDADGVTVTLNHPDGREETARAPYVVGCDGAHSLVRKRIGLSFAGEALPGTFYLADVHVDAGWAEDELRIHGGSTGFFAVFPIHGDRFRIVAPVADDPARGAGPLPPPTLEEVQAIAEERAGSTIRLHDPVWLSAFRISSRVVDRFRVGRVFVAGDAAHIHSPAGGQGMNTGIQDVFNLGWKIALALRGHGGEALLDSYHAERRPNALALLKGTEKATHALTDQGVVASALRTSALTLAGNLGFVREKIAQELSELPIGYRDSPLVGESGSFPRHSPHPGDRAPDADGLVRVPGSTRRLFQWWGQDLRHHLLIFAGNAATPERLDALRAIVRGVNADHGDLIDAVLIRPGTGKAGEEPVLFDTSGAAHERYGVDPSDALYLIRPDGHVGFRAGPADAEALGRHLTAAYG